MVRFNKRWLQRIRVPLAIPFALALFIFAVPTPLSLASGGSAVVLGLALRAWAVGHLRKASVLATLGPYAHVRNPLYAGSLFLCIGVGVASGVWWLGVLLIILMACIYIPVVNVEEGDLLALFGDEFAEYKRNVPAILPRIRPWRNMDGKFDFQLYLKSREYRAALGAAAVMAFLVTKAYFQY